MTEKQFISLDNLLDQDHTVAELVNCIEKHGLICMDKFGRYVDADEDTINIMLDSLAKHYSYANIPLKYASENVNDYWRDWGARCEDFCIPHVLSSAGWWDDELTTPDHLLHSNIAANSDPLPESNNNSPASDDTIPAFDSLPLSGIAQIFPVLADKEKNLKLWKNFASKASENGLITARISKGKGRSQSRFDPDSVADWLVNKGELDRATANRKLAHNLPDRSAGLKDLYLD